MRLAVVLRLVGIVLLLDAMFLAVSAAISALCGDEALIPLLYSALLAALFGVFPLIFVPRIRDISSVEGLFTVVASWVLSCLVGTVPFVLWGGDFTLTNAWFESVSGFTTTGASILRDIESLPAGLLFWRSATNWIGGVGIIVFVAAILPWLGVGGAVLYNAELPERTREAMEFQPRRAMQWLLFIYLLLTVLEIVGLLCCGMSLFDAVTHSFGTVATGGFSPRNASIAAYGSLAVETVVMIFMVLSGMHFALLLAVVFGQRRAPFESAVTRYYFVALIVGVALTAMNVHGVAYERWTESFRYAAFQVVSVGTSTGFANADSSVWPPLAQMILIAFTLQCACAGSTSGGIKVDRIVIFAKAVGREVRRRLHPAAVFSIRVGGKSVKNDLVELSVVYITVYLLVVFVGAALLAALGIDVVTAFSAAAAAMGNVGPGLGTVGSTASYHHIPDAGKWILSVVMILGRLEIYGLLAVFMPRAWASR